MTQQSQTIGLKLLTLVLFIFTSCQSPDSQELRLHALFSDHMVLQQGEISTFWGSFTPNETITITNNWSDDINSVKADADGNWKLALTPPEAGGPYQITIATKDSSIVLKDVMVGEVWLASGQSNMQMPLKGWPPNDPIKNAAQEIVAANYPGIRMFNVVRNYMLNPVDTIGGQWLQCSPEFASEFSATAYFFARRLHRELKVPIGIIHSSWGGTVAEAWTSRKALEELGDFDSKIAALTDATKWQNTKDWFADLDSLLIPQSKEAWEALNFNDLEFSKHIFTSEKNPWKEISLPGRIDEYDDWEFDGTAWLRKDIDIEDMSTGYTLSMGVIDDMDAVYFNGQKIGGLMGYGHHTTERNYAVSKELLKKGKNTIAIRVIDVMGPGTITGSLKLSNNSGTNISLDGAWKYQPISEIYKGKFYVYDLEKVDLSKRPEIMVMGPNLPSVLYNGMVKPLAPYTIKGTIWYQGESNVGRAEQYSRLFPKMIQDWRSLWGTDFPFYYAQIAPYNYGTAVDEEGSMDLRDAQRKSLQTTNTGMVVTMDIGNFTNIHPANKQDVGNRLAGLALANDYNKDIMASGPLYKSHSLSGNKLVLEFDFVGSGLQAKDDKLSGFEIAGDDKKYVPATAEIVGNNVQVSAQAVSSPKYVRYAWSNDGKASLFNKEGLPASTFTNE